MNSIERTLDHMLEGATPSCQISVKSRGRTIFQYHYGTRYKFYDLASLTKIIFTTTALMRAVSSGAMDLEMPLGLYLPWLPRVRPETKFVQLLNHSAGYVWWQPFFKSIDESAPRLRRWDQLKTLLSKTSPNEKNKKAVYSDIDFLLVAYVLMNICGEDVLDIFKDTIGALDIADFHVNVDGAREYQEARYAPTEHYRYESKPRRGIVHDENCFALGGITTHAGMFGSLESVVAWGDMIRSLMRGDVSKRSGISARVAQRFATRSLPKSKGDWGLGFMLPTQGTSSCGIYFSESSIGHTGFSGTSWWYDPKADFMVTMLANRVHPTRENGKFVGLRAPIHNLLYEKLCRS